MNEDFHFDDLPSAFAEDVREYVLRGVPPGEGSFLEAVLCNDLKESFRRAGDVNLAAMFDIVKWCYNHLPMSAWGSAEEAAAWCVLVQDYNEAHPVSGKISNGPHPREGEHNVNSPGLDDREDGDYVSN